MSNIPSLDAAFGKSLHLTFPPVTVRLLNALLDPDPPLALISEYLSMDPLLSGRILHIANSPASSAGIKATSLDQAARILGLNELLKLVVSLSLQKRLQPLVARDPEALYADWRLTVWSAIAAQALAERLCPDLRRQAYLAAMLKDLPLFLAFCGPDLPPFLTREAMALLPSPERAEAEKAFWGKGHPELARDIAAAWGFPEDLAEALSAHHSRAETLPPLQQCLSQATRWGELLHNRNPDPAELIAFELTLKALLGLSDEETAGLRQGCANRFNALLEQLGISRSKARFRLYEHSLKALQEMHFLALAVARPPVMAALRDQLRVFWGISSWDAHIRLPGETAGLLFRCREGILAPETRPTAAEAAPPPGWQTFPFSSTGADIGFL
ncbi:MAG: HDOD domain-containing protein, partial [Desulfovibrio sp.]|nr:HDOD domain-containing protein [Desulfovibrio sp.]